MSSIILFLCLAGFAVWIPGLSTSRRNWYGFRFCIAVFSVPVYLFFGNVLLGVPLTILTWTFAALALAGFGFQIFKRTTTLENYWTLVLHPVVVLPLLTLAVAISLGDIKSLPYPGDETGSWLRHARQVYLADAYWSAKVIYHHGAYTNGWPLMIAFSNVLEGQYSDRNGIVFLFLMHVGVLGFVFDLTRFVAVRNGVNEARPAWLVAWILVLVLLTVEASWVLFPTFQLIEKPLLYAYLVGFLLALAAQYDEFGFSRLAAFLGLVFVTGYLIKVAFVLFAPMLGMVWLYFCWSAYRRQSRDAPETGLISASLLKNSIGWAALMLAPTLIATITWTHFRIGSECFAAPWEFLTNPKQLSSDYSIRVAGVIFEAIIDYAGEYKVPLTAAGAAVLTAALAWKRMRWFVVMIAVFVVIFMLATHLAYNTCYSPFEETGLQSFQRYFRPNLRIIHFFGIIIAAYFLLEKVGKLKVFRGAFKNSWMSGVMALVVVLLLGFQVKQVNRSLVDIDSRQFQGDYIRSSIVNIKRESASLMKFIQTRNLSNPRVSIIAQGGYNVEFNLAQYFGIKSRRGGGYFNYTPERPYSWGEKKTNSFMRKSTPKQLAIWWNEFDVIWPIKTDPWIKNVLTGLVSDAKCRKIPEDYFLFNAGDGTFTCRLKKSAQ